MSIDYRLYGPAIISPGKHSYEMADKLFRAFSGSRIFFDLDKVLSLCFKSYRQIIIIGATGIAVRKIAPYLKNKYNDPAVVVIDTEGKFAISMISGHLGGANILTKKVAKVLGAVPVITTTSDLKGLLTPDYLASSWNLVPEYYNNNSRILLEINSRIIAGKKVNWQIDPSYENEFKEELKLVPYPDLNKLLKQAGTKENPAKAPTIVISDREPAPDPFSVCLRPKSIIAGIGCRKDTPFEDILTHLDDVFNMAGISKLSLRALASIKHKRCELGLIKAGRYLNVPLYFYEPQEIKKYQKEALNDSEFVKKIIGVGGVCEPAAKKAAEKKNSLIMNKMISKSKNVTTALAKVPWPLWALDPEESLL